MTLEQITLEPHCLICCKRAHVQLTGLDESLEIAVWRCPQCQNANRLPVYGVVGTVTQVQETDAAEPGVESAATQSARP